MSFGPARLPFMLRRRDDDDDWYPPEPPAAPPTLRRELAKLIATTLVTVSTTKLVEHVYDRWSKKREEKST